MPKLLRPLPLWEGFAAAYPSSLSGICRVGCLRGRNTRGSGRQTPFLLEVLRARCPYWRCEPCQDCARLGVRANWERWNCEREDSRDQEYSYLDGCQEIFPSEVKEFRSYSYPMDGYQRWTPDRLGIQ